MHNITEHTCNTLNKFTTTVTDSIALHYFEFRKEPIRQLICKKKNELVRNTKINNFLYHICQTEQGKCNFTVVDVDEASNYFSQQCKVITVSSTALTL